MVERHAEGRELGLVPTGAQAEGEAPTADLVQRRRHLGQDGRIAKGGTGDECANLDPGGRLGQRREDGPALPDAARRPVRRPVDEMVVEPEGIEARPFRSPGEVPYLGVARRPPYGRILR
jgi:hypothetical protein